MDGTDFRIQEPSPFDPKWYSHKFKTSGLRYEVGICLTTGNIVWVNGPYACGEWPDLRITRDLLIHYLEHREMIVADKGYRDNFHRCLTPTDDKPNLNRIMAKWRARHETVNRRFKQFGVLQSVFRHKIEKHQMCFDAVVNLVQMMIEQGHFY